MSNEYEYIRWWCIFLTLLHKAGQNETRSTCEVFNTQVLSHPTCIHSSLFSSARDVVLGTRTRTHTRQMRSTLSDADVSALIFLKCNDMSCVWHACTSTSTRPNCLLSHCKHETIRRVWVFNSVSNVFVLGSKKTIYAWLAITLVLTDIVFLLEINVIIINENVIILVLILNSNVLVLATSVLENLRLLLPKTRH